MLVHLLLEGHLEEPVADKLLKYCGHDKGTVYGRQGYKYIKARAHKFEPLALGNCALLVLTDFRDSKANCPPEALNEYLLKYKPNPSSCCLFRFVEMELESWLLADRKAIATFLKISSAVVPNEPDKEVLPKKTLVDLARRSKNAEIKNAIVPPENHGGQVGPNYLIAMTDFVKNHWRPAEAAKNSPSLQRCLKRLLELNQKK